MTRSITLCRFSFVNAWAGINVVLCHADNADVLSRYEYCSAQLVAPFRSVWACGVSAADASQAYISSGFMTVSPSPSVRPVVCRLGTAVSTVPSRRCLRSAVIKGICHKGNIYNILGSIVSEIGVDSPRRGALESQALHIVAVLAPQETFSSRRLTSEPRCSCTLFARMD